MKQQQFIQVSITLVLFLLVTLKLCATNNDESLISVGISNTANGAKIDAIKSAISTAFRVYSSDSIDILYESGFFGEIEREVKFDFVNYEVYYETSMQGYSNNQVAILNVNLSIDKLNDYLASKGFKTSIQLNELLYNIKHQALLEQSEISSISRLIGILHQSMQGSYDYSITYESPTSLNSQSTEWKIPLKVKVTANEYSEKGYDLSVNLLRNLSPLQYKGGVQISTTDLKPVFIFLDDNSNQQTFYLRKQISIDLLKSLESAWENFTRLFIIDNGIEQMTGWDKNWSNGLSFWGSERNSRIPNLKFYSANEVVCYYNWDDERNMEELNKIKTYEIDKIPVSFSYANGGIEIKGLKVILAPILKNQIGETTDSKIYFNGYDDWRSVTNEEMDYINRSIRKWKKLWGNEYEFRSRRDKNWLGDYSNVLVRNPENSYENKIKQKKYTLPIESSQSGLNDNSIDSEQKLVTDIDGNTYRTIKIGNQTWMIDNLRVTHYRDGTEIPNISNDNEWTSLNTGAYCNYNNNAEISKKFGNLYNWYAVKDTRNIAPLGWHVATLEDWVKLQEYLKANYGIVPAKVLAANTDWDSNTTIGTVGYDITKNNVSNFTALPSGYRHADGWFLRIGSLAGWWTTNETVRDYAWSYGMNEDSSELYKNESRKTYGKSVRCVKD